jgi:hypothetical protein
MLSCKHCHSLETECFSSRNIPCTKHRSKTSRVLKLPLTIIPDFFYFVILVRVYFVVVVAAALVVMVSVAAVKGMQVAFVPAAVGVVVVVVVVVVAAAVAMVSVLAAVFLTAAPFAVQVFDPA